MTNATSSFSIGALADRASVNSETIRFYQRKGLMRVPIKPPSGIRRYGENDLVRLRFIKSAQHLGFSLKEVGELLNFEDGAHCVEAREQAEIKLAEVREKLAGLKRIEEALIALIDNCDSHQEKGPCPLIATLQE
ncbi:MerR family transcriptional regulator [Hahella aquimaris]|uniref:MerR family transcriptional regulator n=1 Tax=Hahella sp. HNIBRBA332 TaxID=3015983 RepID=UPI00273ADE2C|nr:MerR family transcriptional regulator [Hahella sp. HNIBRBA332]WLQ13294.1 MerR family transcriptional regulator [Hahella sp. HNIBRBA332]